MKIDWKSFTKHRTKDSKGFPTGSMVFYGHQGNGKTLSLVRYVEQVKKDYPKCKIYSNVILKNVPDFIRITTPSDLSDALSVGNGREGVLVCLDEAHLFFNNTRGGISLDVLTAISQQRKDRRHIVFTTQIWEEMDISLRKQVPTIVKCRRLWNMIILTYYNGFTMKYHKQENEFIAEKDHTEIFKLHDYLYNSYDTYQKIMTNREYSREFANNSYRTQLQSSKR